MRAPIILFIFPSLFPLLGVLAHATPKKLSEFLSLLDFGPPSIMMALVSLPALSFFYLAMQKIQLEESGLFDKIWSWSIFGANLYWGLYLILDQLLHPYTGNGILLGLGVLITVGNVFIFFRTLKCSVAVYRNPE